MKVEATCTNEECIGFRRGILIPCERVDLEAKKPIDAYTVVCPYCQDDTLEVTKLTTEDAQLALGDVTLSRGVIELYGGEKFVAAQALSKLVAEHARWGAHSNPSGEAVSDWVRESTAISIITNFERTKTVVMLAREYPFATS